MPYPFLLSHIHVPIKSTMYMYMYFPYLSFSLLVSLLLQMLLLELLVTLDSLCLTKDVSFTNPYTRTLRYSTIIAIDSDPTLTRLVGVTSHAG